MKHRPPYSGLSPSLQRDLDGLCGPHGWCVIGVSALVYDTDQFFLEINRPRHWHSAVGGRPVVTLGAIGGSLEADETLLACLTREGEEELNLDLDAQDTGCTQLLFRGAPWPGNYGDGDRPRPWFLSVERYHGDDAGPTPDFVAIVTYLAQIHDRPALGDLFGLLSVPHFRLHDALPARSMPFWSLCQDAAAQVEIRLEIPVQSLVRPVYTAESIRRMLKAGIRPRV